MSESTGEEHELPTVEAVLAGTLALMTGYSQSLLAELQPEHRVLMGRKIGNNLALLAEHPQLSVPFQAVLGGLQRRWTQMAGCTAEAAPLCRPSACPFQAPDEVRHSQVRATPFVFEAPTRLQ
jgi:hypothetical protein